MNKSLIARITTNKNEKDKKENENENEIDKEEDVIYTGEHKKGRHVYVYIASDNEEVKEACALYLSSYHPQIRGSVLPVFILC